MQGAICAAWLPCAFRTKYGSASIGRAMEIMSAHPSARTCSPTSGVLIRFDVMIRTPGDGLRVLHHTTDRPVCWLDGWPEIEGLSDGCDEGLSDTLGDIDGWLEGTPETDGLSLGWIDG